MSIIISMNNSIQITKIDFIKLLEKMESFTEDQISNICVSLYLDKLKYILLNYILKVNYGKY